MIYRILKAETLPLLEKKVQLYLDHDWELQGGILQTTIKTSPFDFVGYYCQAVIAHNGRGTSRFTVTDPEDEA